MTSVTICKETLHKSNTRITRKFYLHKVRKPGNELHRVLQFMNLINSYKVIRTGSSTIFYITRFASNNFLHNNLFNYINDAIAGNDLTPLSISLRKKQKGVASFLLTKQWSKINYTQKHAIQLSLFVKMKRWAERAKEKVNCIIVIV